MKKLLLIVLMALGANVHSAEVIGGTVLFYSATGASVTTIICTAQGLGGCDFKREAAQIVEDGQGYIQSGELSLYLGQKIKDLQAIDNTISEAEAFDLLITKAQTILAE